MSSQTVETKIQVEEWKEEPQKVSESPKQVETIQRKEKIVDPQK